MGFGGPQPLSLAEIKSYCEFKGIFNVDDRLEFLHLIQVMDGVWLKNAIEKAKKKPT